MKLKLKKASLIAILCLAVPTLNHCLILDELPLLKPLGSFDGKESLDRIGDTISISFLLGVYGFCSQFQAPDDCMEEYSPSLVTGLLTARFVAGSRLALEEDKYYTVKSVVDCQKKFSAIMNIMTVKYLDNNKKCNFFSCTPADSGQLIQAALVNSLVTSNLCQIKQTGNILSIYNYNLDLPFLPDL